MRALPHRDVAALVDTVRASGAAPVITLAFEFLVVTALPPVVHNLLTNNVLNCTYRHRSPLFTHILNGIARHPEHRLRTDLDRLYSPSSAVTRQLDRPTVILHAQHGWATVRRTTRLREDAWYDDSVFDTHAIARTPTTAKRRSEQAAADAGRPAAERSEYHAWRARPHGARCRCWRTGCRGASTARLTRPETPRWLGVSAHPPRSMTLRRGTPLRCVSAAQAPRGAVPMSGSSTLGGGEALQKLRRSLPDQETIRAGSDRPVGMSSP